MKKYKRILQLLMICLVMVLGVWLGMKIEHRQNEKHEEYLQGLNTTVAVVNQDLGVTINDMSVNYANAVIETLGSEYTVVSASAAQRGFEDGTYGAIILALIFIIIVDTILLVRKSRDMKREE